MKEKKTGLLRGTLDFLRPWALSLGSLRGLGVSQRIEQVTKGALQGKSGSPFPALYRMEAAGGLKPSWGESENNRKAKNYRLAPAGRRQFETETEDGQRIALAIPNTLKAT